MIGAGGSEVAYIKLLSLEGLLRNVVNQEKYGYSYYKGSNSQFIYS